MNIKDALCNATANTTTHPPNQPGKIFNTTRYVLFYSEAKIRLAEEAAFGRFQAYLVSFL